MFETAQNVELLHPLLEEHNYSAFHFASFLRANGIRRVGDREIDENGWWTGIWCRECKKKVEPVRRCWAIPMCYDCIPPPPPLPVAPLRGSERAHEGD